MIPKRIPMRNVNVSSFSKLADYITHAQDKHERVGTITVTNCHATDPWWAAQEVEGVQRQNIRSKLDKTYHLLISFRAGEQPTPEVLKQIEERFCKELGYGEHQRISAVHHDTDHLHIHVAINKIHPDKLTALEPYYDMPKLGALASKLEIEYGLQQDNHIPRLTKSAAKARDMEQSAGIETLIGWVKRGCLNDLLAAPSWESLHEVLAHNRLQILPRGNGLIITNGTVGAKASSIDRQLSKHALEKRLGAFRASAALDHQNAKVKAEYQIRPMASKVNTTVLWQQYQRERAGIKARQSGPERDANEDRKRRIETAKREARQQRSLFRLVKGRWARNMLYSHANNNLLKKIRRINEDYIKNRREMYADSKRLIWYDWLKEKAKQGNTQALAVLANRYERTLPHSNANVLTAAGVTMVSGQVPTINLKIDNVTKRGIVHYRGDRQIIRDDGKAFRLSDNLSDDQLKSVLQLAIRRFGDNLEVKGTEKFKTAMMQIAGSNLFNVTFTDPALEAQRKNLRAERLSQVTHRQETPEGVARKYITERNEKRARGFSHILPHRPYTDKDIGQYAFAGLNRTEKANLLLLKTPSQEILVKPVDDKTAYRVKYLDIGNQIDVAADGAVQARAEGHVRMHRLVRTR